MPTDLRNRPERIKEARWKVVKDLTELVGHRCEIKKIYGSTDLHEFLGTSKSVYDDEVSLLLLTHPSNIVVINHNLHINREPAWETCMAATRHRNNKIWLHFGFGNYYEALIDFNTKLQEFYKTQQIKIPLSYFPKEKPK